MTNKINEVHFKELLVDLLENPNSELGKYYSAFHNYSLSNVLYVWMQTKARGIKFGPIATYRKWQEMGRQVQAGQKAMEIVAPRIAKSKTEVNADGSPKEFLYFVITKSAFVLDQTEGGDMPDFPESAFDFENVHKAFDIEQVQFDMPNGNVQGYAFTNKFAINPVAKYPHKTKIHEMAHILLGHTRNEKATIVDREQLDINKLEVEAESVAFCVLSAIGGDFEAERKVSRGYVRKWLKGGDISEDSAKKILKVANQILQAGFGKSQEGE